MSADRSPVIEEIDGDPDHVLATIAWRGDADRVAVVGGPAGWSATNGLMERGPDGVWRRSFVVSRALRAVYALLPNPPDELEFTLEVWYSLLPDPLNPKTFVFPGDTEDPGWERDAVRSVLEGPDAPAEPWVEPRPGIAAGSTELHRFRSGVLGNERRVYVYTPAGFDVGQRYPLLVLCDGWAYVHVIPTPTILDNLIAAGRIPPLVAVLPDNPDRDRELTCHPPFVEFLTDELLPWARGRWRVTDDPALTTVGGSSLGGLSAAYAAYRRPDVFGNVLSQSGSFGWMPEGDEEPEWLLRQLADAESLPIRFWLEAGLLDLRELRGRTSILASNRRLRGILEAKGCDVLYSEFAGAHDYICWRGSLADGLVALAAEAA